MKHVSLRLRALRALREGPLGRSALSPRKGEATVHLEGSPALPQTASPSHLPQQKAEQLDSQSRTSSPLPGLDRPAGLPKQKRAAKLPGSGVHGALVPVLGTRCKSTAATCHRLTFGSCSLRRRRCLVVHGETDLSTFYQHVEHHRTPKVTASVQAAELGDC